MHPVDTRAATPDKTAGDWTRTLVFWSAASAVLALDQLTKELVRSFLARGDAWPSEDWPVRLYHVTNTGAAFGILEDQTAFLILMTVIGLAAIYLYYRNPPFDHVLAPLAIGLMLGGAVGNLVDRIRLGRVTDFIDFPMWPAFNVADSAITIGVVAVIVGYAFLSGRTNAERSDNP